MTDINLYIIIGTLLAGILGGAIKLWAVSVDRAAIAKAKEIQAEQHAKEQARFAEETRLLKIELDAVMETTTQLRSELNLTIKSLDEYLSKPDIVDRPASQLLKDTIRILGGQK